ncbi:GntR family transcriptional regulator [Listeria fleischmannii]|jgi:GntR family transcriptional regulator|uniref:GntR family transcriptional regulator n=1 Tax=Listeria fleischmannii TaxID=1069827 RepID=UPI00162A385F|nr:GntR family transcriptional regulator [Listeria fleischmannii]MBC1419781.1 GntR family transcriptional regulator [Listeria fleischmannii]
MLLQIDLQKEEPIYMQIVHQIIEGIAKNELKPGDDLPSVRSLGADIGINFHTVNKAYQILKQEGFILIHRQKGVVIHPDAAYLANTAYVEKLKRDIRPIIAEAAARNLPIREMEKLVETLYNEMKGE